MSFGGLAGNQNRTGNGEKDMSREEVFEKVLKYSTKEFREFSTASLITRSTMIFNKFKV